MLELKRIQDNPEELEAMLKKRRYTGVDINAIKKLIQQTKEIQTQADALRNERNIKSKEIGTLIGAGKKDEAGKLKESVRATGERIAQLDAEHAKLEETMADMVLALPNYLNDEVPDGATENDNKLIKTHGEIKKFNFKPKTHYEIGEALGLIDFERGVKISGSRFYSYRGIAATLERSIISFMLDLHTKKFNYTEMWVPQLVDDTSMQTTGQYPKFKGEFYRLNDDNLSLIPTAEVPLVNLYRNEIIEESELPIALTAATSCFRREAGAAGRDTRGLVRVHQFQKVELVQLVHPDHSCKIHEEMLTHAEEVLKRLNIPYRVVLLCSGDIGATSSKTYDIEVWMPGLNRWLEISSISNCLDYQARRGMIRFKESGTKSKPKLVHTLNGSGLAAGRTLIAIMENYQKSDGTFDIPDVLKPYMERSVD